MSHELRTPLNAIIGFSEVLSERMFGEINDKQAEYLGDILESGRHLLSLINDILDLSKIEAGRMELEPSEFHLPGAIDNTLTLLRERAQRRDVRLGREFGEGVGMIRADERKVKQVLLNLLSNALKFTPDGGQIDVKTVVRDGDGGNFGDRHRRGHRSRGPRSGVRGIPAGRDRGEEGGRHGARPRDFTEVHRAPRRPDLGDERARRRLDVRLHLADVVRSTTARRAEGPRRAVRPDRRQRVPRSMTMPSSFTPAMGASFATRTLTHGALNSPMRRSAIACA